MRGWRCWDGYELACQGRCRDFLHWPRYSYSTLDITGNGATFNNNSTGVVRATGSGGMDLRSGFFQNFGTVEVAASSTIRRLFTYDQFAGSTTVNGRFEGGVLMNLQGGSLGGDGVVVATVNNIGGTVGPGNSPGTLTVDGQYIQESTGTFAVELAGLTPGTEFDVMEVIGGAGHATLGGALQVSLLNSFKPVLGNVFDIITTTGNVIGEFDMAQLNLPVFNGRTFEVQYGQNFVRLLTVAAAQSSAVPSPPTFLLFLAGVLVLLHRYGWCPRMRPRSNHAAASGVRVRSIARG